MEYREITITTTSEGIDIVSGLLTMQGIRGVVINDPTDFNVFLQESQERWDYVDESLLNYHPTETSVTFYLPQNAQGMEIYRNLPSDLARLQKENPAVDLGQLTVTANTCNEEDWSTAWKKYYHPTKVGERLVVVPSWENYEKKETETIVTMNPGMAFGTGTHETTRLCMRLLETCVTKDTDMLDIGTGSGILAITALLLGAKSAVGVDIDEVAVKTAGENAELNGVRDRLTLLCGDLTEKVGEKKFDVVCANIVADVIIRLSATVTRYLAKGGVFLVSGIIEERCGEVKTALRDAGLIVEETLTDNGWAAIKTRL